MNRGKDQGRSVHFLELEILYFSSQRCFFKSQKSKIVLKDQILKIFIKNECSNDAKNVLICSTVSKKFLIENLAC